MNADDCPLMGPAFECLESNCHYFHAGCLYEPQDKARNSDRALPAHRNSWGPEQAPASSPVQSQQAKGEVS